MFNLSIHVSDESMKKSTSLYNVFDIYIHREGLDMSQDKKTKTMTREGRDKDKDKDGTAPLSMTTLLNKQPKFRQI